MTGEHVDLVRLAPQDTDLVLALEREVFPEDPWTRAMVREELTSPWSVYVAAVGAHPRSAAAPASAMGGPSAGADALPLRADRAAGAASRTGQLDLEGVLGWAGVRVGPDADVMTIGVRATARRRGIGRTLLLRLIDEARRAGSERLFLEVRASNEAAIGLYRSVGFESLGLVRRYFRTPSSSGLRKYRRRTGCGWEWPCGEVGPGPASAILESPVVQKA